MVEQQQLPISLKVIKWNLDRGLLDKGFDPALEAKMLAEEAYEFYSSKDLVNMFREAADFTFVFMGTRAKWAADVPETAMAKLYSYEDYKRLCDWATDLFSDMLRILEEVTPKAYELIEKALEIVMEANEAKPKECVNGKVIKGDEYQSPHEAIRKMLQEEGGLKV